MSVNWKNKITENVQGKPQGAEDEGLIFSTLLI